MKNGASLAPFFYARPPTGSSGISRINWPKRQALSVLPLSLQISANSTLGNGGRP